MLREELESSGLKAAEAATVVIKFHARASGTIIAQVFVDAEDGRAIEQDRRRLVVAVITSLAIDNELDSLLGSTTSTTGGNCWRPSLSSRATIAAAAAYRHR